MKTQNALQRAKGPGQSGFSKRARRVVALGAAFALVVLPSAGPALEGGQAPTPRAAKPAAQASQPSLARLKDGPKAQAKALKSFGNQPLRFELNRGQAPKEVKFLVRTPKQTLFLTSTEMILMSTGGADETAALGKGPAPVRISLAKRGAKPKISGVSRLPGVSNYFQGRDSKAWVTGAPSFAKVLYKGVYPGIDLLFYENRKGGGLEYDFLVSPGANPASITQSISGATRLGLDKGELVITAPGNEIRQSAPVIYQKIDGRRRLIKGAYMLGDRNSLGFRVGRYDESRTLIIDPVLAWSTLMGDNGSSGDTGSASDGSGTGSNHGPQVATDASGNAYLAGWTAKSFPTQAAFQPVPAGGFVAKFAPNGSLIYSTYLGESSTFPHDIAVDSVGNAYIGGTTSWYDFPTTANAFRPASPSTMQLSKKDGGEHGPVLGSGSPTSFLSKLDIVGRLAYSTYLWPTQGDRGGGSVDNLSAVSVAVSDEKNVFVTGLDFTGTRSGETWAFPYRACPGADNENGGRAVPFVAKFDTGVVAGVPAAAQGSVEGPPPLFLKCGYGGRDLALHGGSLYALDDGFGSRITTSGPPYEPKGVWRLGTADGSPGAHSDLTGLAIATSPTGSPDTSVYVSNKTSITKLDENLAAVEPALSPGSGVILNISVDSKGKLYAVGQGRLGDISTTPDAYQKELRGGVRDAFVMVFDAAGSRVYSTWLGGSPSKPPALTDAEVPCEPLLTSGDDHGTGVGVDGLGNFFVVGITVSYNFPVTANAFQKERKTRCVDGSPGADSFMSDVFAAKFTDALPSLTGIAPEQGFVCERTKVTIKGTGFPDTPAVTFGGRAAEVIGVTHDPDPAKGDTITVMSPTMDAPGPAEVKVTSAGGNSSSTALLGSFRYLPATPPTVQSVSPVSGSPLGGEPVTIAGSFACVTKIAFGDVPPKDFVLSDDRTKITATSPEHDPGPVHVTVATAAGVPGIPQSLNADLFTFAPLITAVDPPTGPTLGATKVRIAGKGFLRATKAVAFGGLPAPFTVASDTEIEATSPAHPAGDVSVAVSTTENLQAVPKVAGANLFTYLLPKVAVPLDEDPGKGGTDGGKAIVQPVIPGGGTTSAAPVTQPAQAPNPQPLGNAQPGSIAQQNPSAVLSPGAAPNPGFALAPGGAGSPLANPRTASAGVAVGGYQDEPSAAPRLAMVALNDREVTRACFMGGSTLLLLLFGFSLSFARRRPLAGHADATEACPAPQIA